MKIIEAIFALIGLAFSAYTLGSLIYVWFDRPVKYISEDKIRAAIMKYGNLEDAAKHLGLPVDSIRKLT